MEAKDRLVEYGIKPSLHRIAIMDYLIKNHVHPAADTIFSSLYPSIPTLSKTTVYNTLKLFEEQGAVAAIVIDEKNVRYDADLSPHAHFRCKKCGAIHDLKLENFEAMKVVNAGNLQITECQVYFGGYCGNCSILTDYSVN
ncbi:MAG: transcriptional repressor [Dysgonamonadaceae bacterium]|nr:transcriptional repressor [Dysgonamonadaceae bacterium]